MRILNKTIEQIENEGLSATIDLFVLDYGGLIFHEVELNKIFSKNFSSLLSYNLAYESDVLIGICPIHTIKSKLTEQLYSGPGIFEIPFGGWVFNDQVVSEQDLLHNTKIKKNQVLVYNSNIKLSDEDSPSFGNVKRRETAVVDLSLELDEIFTSSVSSKRRNMIRKAQKSGFSIKEMGSEGIEYFFPLMESLSEKVGLKMKPVNFYNEIFQHYHIKKQAYLLIAFHEEKAISGLIMLGNKNLMHYYQGASNLEVQNAGQGDSLQWEAIQIAQKSKSKYYDLCVVDKENLPAIAKFKLGFSKQIVPYFSLTHKSPSYRIINKIQKWVSGQ